MPRRQVDRPKWRNWQTRGIQNPDTDPVNHCNQSTCENEAPAGTYLGAYPPELAPVVEAWGTLPEHLKAAILALVATAQPPGKGGGR